MEYARSGSKLEEVELLAPQGKDSMISVSPPVVKAFTMALFRQTGILRGMGMILRTNTWEMITKRPKWHPEYFEFADKEQEKVFKEYFKILSPFIVLHDDLKQQYGEYLADEIMANIATPTHLAIYSQFSWVPKDRTDIEQWRQTTANAFGNKAYERTERVSEDKTEFHMRWTKCAPVMILKAYGVHSFAESCCLNDHILVGCTAPEVIFSRTCIMGAGDPYCDHTIRVPLSEDDKKEESDYADCLKVKGGRERVRHWEETYKRFNEFRF